MQILNPSLISDYKPFTDLQKQYLAQAGFKYLGDVLALSPLRIDEIQPMSDSLIPGVKYQNQFTVVAVSHRKSQRGLPYVVLNVSDGLNAYQAFLFSRAKFILVKLRAGETVTAVFGLYGNSAANWNKSLIIHKLSFGGVSSTPITGQRVEVFYPKQSLRVDTTFLRRIHSRIKIEDYVVELQPITTWELLDSHQLNLYPMHHPDNFQELQSTQQQFLTLRVYLKTTLQKYITHLHTDHKLAESPPLDLNWLKWAVSKLPVTLTASQKGAIWEVLQDVTVDWETK